MVVMKQLYSSPVTEDAQVPCFSANKSVVGKAFGTFQKSMISTKEAFGK